MRKESDAFVPLSQLELTLGLVETCPTRLPQLFLQLRGDLCFRFKRLGRRFEGLGCALTLMLSLESLKAGADRENADRRHHRVTNALMGLFAPFLLRHARLDVISLFSAKRRSKVFD